MKFVLKYLTVKLKTMQILLKIKEIEEKIRIQEKRMKEFRKISVGTDFSNREKFFR